jgi:hypothetical protein
MRMALPDMSNEMNETKLQQLIESSKTAQGCDVGKSWQEIRGTANGAGRAVQKGMFRRCGLFWKRGGLRLTEI